MIPEEFLNFWMYPRLLNAYGYLKCLRKTYIYRSLEKLSNMWTNLIGDKCYNLSRENLRFFLQDTWHHLIGWNVLNFKMTHVSTKLDCLCHCQYVYTCDWFLYASFAFVLVTLSKFLLVFWIVMVVSTCSTDTLLLAVVYKLSGIMWQLVIGWEFFFFTNILLYIIWYEMKNLNKESQLTIFSLLVMKNCFNLYP